MTTMATTLANDPSAKPDFIAPIYGFMLPVTPPANPQPMFVALASDDPFGVDVIRDSMQAYGIAKKANHLRVQAASLSWGEIGRILERPKTFASRANSN